MTRRTFFMANSYCHDFNENYKEERFYYIPRIRRFTRYFKNLVVVKPNTLLCYNLKFKRALRRFWQVSLIVKCPIFLILKK